MSEQNEAQVDQAIEALWNQRKLDGSPTRIDRQRLLKKAGPGVGGHGIDEVSLVTNMGPAGSGLARNSTEPGQPDP